MRLSLTTPRQVTPEALNVEPALLGRRLATPARRAGAMALDLALIALASTVVNAWLIGALVVLAWAIVRSRRDGALPLARRRGLLALVALMVVMAGVDAWRIRHVRSHDTLSPGVGPTLDQAARSLVGAASGVAAAASAPDPEAALERAGTDAALEAMGDRIKALEAEVRRLRGAPPDWREKAAAWLDELGLGYGGALLYFTLVPLAWPGQTVGKKLLGLRVVELSGRPVTGLLNLKRFGGYMAGLATGGVGLAQITWDRNAQGLQDRAAHTLVLDERPVANASPP